MVDLALMYVVGPDGKKQLTIPDDRRAAAIAFIHEASARTPKEIEALVQQGHDHLFAALAGVSESQAAHKPSADDWSILELMAHVVTTKRVVVALSTNLGDGHLPAGFGPQFEEAAAQDGVTVARFDTLAEARSAAQAAHEDLLAYIRRLDAGVNTEIRFKHFVFGALNSREWAVFQRIHDDNHAPQLSGIKTSPGFAAA